MPTMTIPTIRAELRKIAFDPKTPAKIGERLTRLADELTRRPSEKRAERSSTAMSAAMAGAIRTFAEKYPQRTQHEIAEHFGVNQGRVSEVLSGQRGAR